MQTISALFYFVFLFSGLTLQVAGHGFVHSVAIDGKEYQGWNPFSDPYASFNPWIWVEFFGVDK